MTRRSPSDRYRGPAIALVASLVIVAATATILAACGGGSTGGSTTTAPTATTTVTSTQSAAPTPSEAPTPPSASQTTLSLYYLRGEELGVAERRVDATTKPATAALEALLAGPSASEKAAGLTSAVPSGTRLLALSIDGTTARVDLSSRFAAGGGSLSMQARVAQVVYTLTRFPTIDAVDFMLDGAMVETLGGEGLILDAGQTRADWRAFEPAIFVEQPGVGALLAGTLALQGTASVFEGTFAARLEDG